MFVRRLCFLTMLVAIAAFVGVEHFNVQVKGLDIRTLNSRPTGSAIASDIPLSSASQSVMDTGRSSWVNTLRRESDRGNAFLPVQSKETKNLGVGKLLVASRGLSDPIFAQKVILLVRYDEQGVLGLMLNRRTDVPLSHVLEGVKAAKDLSDPVYLGGPVETPTAFALLKSPAKLEGAEPVFGSVYLISTKTLFEETMSKRPESSVFHVYLGYSGWTAPQLRKEVELGAWFIFPADTKTVFDSDPDSLWPRMIQKTELKLAGSRPSDADAALSRASFEWDR